MTWSRVCMQTLWVQHLSPRYGRVILVGGYLFLTAVNWPWNGSPTSNCKDISCMYKLTQVDLYIFFGHQLAQLSSVTTSEPAIWSCDTGQRVSCLTAVNLHEYPMWFSWCKPLCNLIFTKNAWPRCHVCATLLSFTTIVGDSFAPSSYTAIHVDHEKKKNVWVLQLLCVVFLCFSNFYRFGAKLR